VFIYNLKLVPVLFYFVIAKLKQTLRLSYQLFLLRITGPMGHFELVLEVLN